MEKAICRIEGFKHYIIYSNGDVYSLLKKKMLKQMVKKPYNYCMVYLTSIDSKAKSKWFYVHRLVAFHFIGANKPGYEIHHVDNDKTNNNYTNLKWVTHKKNVILSYKEGNRKPITTKKPHSEQAKLKMSKAKQKSIKVYHNGSLYKHFSSIEQCYKHFNKYRKWLERIIKKWNGYSFSLSN